MIKRKKIKLDKYEQEIEDNIGNSSISENQEELKRQLIEAARRHVKSKKSITIRLSSMDIEAMKIKASKVGVPYQTYINMLIHKDANSI